MNKWDLYETQSGWKRANAALESAWRRIVTRHIVTRMTPSEIWEQMRPIMEKYSDLGACDSEPRNVLEDRIEWLMQYR